QHGAVVAQRVRLLVERLGTLERLHLKVVPKPARLRRVEKIVDGREEVRLNGDAHEPWPSIPAARARGNLATMMSTVTVTARTDGFTVIDDLLPPAKFDRLWNFLQVQPMRRVE